MNKQCRTEVIELHQFFQDWFLGLLENTDQSFQRLDGALSSDFQIVGPGGSLTPRDRLLDGLRRSHGSRAGKKFRIWIENYQGRPIGEGLWLITYEEWQEDEKERSGRLSSAVFRRKPGNPNKVEWLHVHEVWLPRQE